MWIYDLWPFYARLMAKIKSQHRPIHNKLLIYMVWDYCRVLSPQKCYQTSANECNFYAG